MENKGEPNDTSGQAVRVFFGTLWSRQTANAQETP